MPDLDRLARMSGYRDATHHLLTRASFVNQMLAGRLTRRNRKLYNQQFAALMYALDVLNVHYHLMYDA